MMLLGGVEGQVEERDLLPGRNDDRLKNKIPSAVEGPVIRELKPNGAYCRGYEQVHPLLRLHSIQHIMDKLHKFLVEDIKYLLL